ncbi:integrase core domain-containing protein [Micromonospora fluostatini]|uniref:integrase core domain-containing protein n=1 Tax=Micromonospora sp. JCM 30529 TaxID=3421643 RepID=UPI003D169C6D
MQSMSRVGRALNNAAAEAFNSTMKVECVHRQRLRTRSETRLKTATWIIDFYNVRRHHSACDGMSPVDYERFVAQVRRARAASTTLRASEEFPTSFRQELEEWETA